MGLLSEIGNILAEAVKGQPAIAAVCLLIVICAAVIVRLKANSKVGGLLVVSALAICMTGFLSYIEIERQKESLRKPAEITISPKANSGTVSVRLTYKQKKDIQTVLRKATEDVAGSLSISSNRVRANIFAPDEHDNMRAIPELTYNMDRPEELTLTIPAGYGSTGRCFRSGQPNIAILREGWGNAAIADQELRKVHPDLQWIISVPVKGDDEAARPIWVMNIDGLKERRSEKQLQTALRHLYAWSYAISLIISQMEQPIVRKALDPSVNTLEITELQEHVLVRNIRTGDIATSTDNVFKATYGFSSMPPLNVFTRKEFDEQVRRHFVYKLQ